MAKYKDLHVLTLNISNKQIVDLVDNIKKEFGSKHAPSNPHITLRGPQRSFNKKITNNITSFLSDEDIEWQIDGTGSFKIGEKVFVYLRVKAPAALRESRIWRKSDYPLKKYGFNPHITIFKGEQSLADEIIKRFSNFQLTIYSTEMEFSTSNIEQPEIEDL